MTRLLPYVLTTVLMTNGMAHAYIDPGSANIIMQTLIGAITAAGLFLSIRLRRFFHRRSTSSDGPNSQSNNKPSPNKPSP